MEERVKEKNKEKPVKINQESWEVNEEYVSSESYDTEPLRGF